MMIFVSFVRTCKWYDYDQFDNIVINDHIETSTDITRIEIMLNTKFASVQNGIGVNCKIINWKVL